MDGGLSGSRIRRRMVRVSAPMFRRLMVVFLVPGLGDGWLGF